MTGTPLGEIVFALLAIVLALALFSAWEEHSRKNCFPIVPIAIALLTFFAGYITEHEVQLHSAELRSAQDRVSETQSDLQNLNAYTQAEIRRSKDSLIAVQNDAAARIGIAESGAYNAQVQAARAQQELNNLRTSASAAISVQEQEISGDQRQIQDLKTSTSALQNQIAQANTALSALRARSVSQNAHDMLAYFARTHPYEQYTYRTGPSVEDAAVFVDGVNSALRDGGSPSQNQALDSAFRVNPAFAHVLVAGNPATGEAYAFASDLMAVDPGTRYMLDPHVPVGTLQIYVGVRT